VEVEYNSVINKENDWAIFGYKGKRKIVFLASGKGGIKEVSKLVLDRKIMYIFIRLDKLTIVTWVGLKVDPIKLNKVNKHQLSIKLYFKQAQVEKYATTIEELEQWSVPSKSRSMSEDFGRFASALTLRKISSTDDNNKQPSLLEKLKALENQKVLLEQSLKEKDTLLQKKDMVITEMKKMNKEKDLQIEELRSDIEVLKVENFEVVLKCSEFLESFEASRKKNVILEIQKMEELRAVFDKQQMLIELLKTNES